MVRLRALFPIILLFVLPAQVAWGQLPNQVVTPGAIRPSATVAELCAPHFSTKKYRHTTPEMKRQACAAYGFGPHDCPHQGAMEIDHLIPLELGGADDVRNLWPQLATYPYAPGFHVKDRLENELRRQVCAKQMTLGYAQVCIATDWIRCYQSVRALRHTNRTILPPIR